MKYLIKLVFVYLVSCNASFGANSTESPLAENIKALLALTDSNAKLFQSTKPLELGVNNPEKLRAKIVQLYIEQIILTEDLVKHNAVGKLLGVSFEPEADRASVDIKEPILAMLRILRHAQVQDPFALDPLSNGKSKEVLAPRKHLLDLLKLIKEQREVLIDLKDGLEVKPHAPKTSD